MPEERLAQLEEIWAGKTSEASPTGPSPASPPATPVASSPEESHWRDETALLQPSLLLAWVKDQDGAWMLRMPPNTTQQTLAQVMQAAKRAIDRMAVYERNHGICHVCGESVDPESFYISHLVPIARGGVHHPKNLTVTHPECALAEGNTV